MLFRSEATDEASHEGRADEKVKALEAIDQYIVGPIHQALKKQGEYRILVMPDHSTPVSTKKHSHGWVPFAVCGSGISHEDSTTYDELSAASSGLSYPHGWDLIPKLMRGDLR